MSIDKTAIRNASTVIAIRDRDTTPSILMGQRGAKAAFMPNKFVFPGGAVDAADGDVPLASTLSDLCHACFGPSRPPAGRAGLTRGSL
jgi:8-oxo-dGTP pyrophosphatase MutT (NUDIX family)